MMQIKTNFNPYRMKISKKEPVSFTVELKNDSEEAKILTMKITLNKELSFEKAGYKTEAMERINCLASGEKKEFYYNLFPKPMAKTGEHHIKIDIEEHYKNYQYVLNRHKKIVTLRVDD